MQQILALCEDWNFLNDPRVYIYIYIYIYFTWVGRKVHKLKSSYDDVISAVDQ